MIDAPGIQERYLAATRSSGLRVEADKPGDADLLIAAAWSPSRFGAALLRLHSEWDGAERRGVRVPRKATRAKVQALARELTPKGEKTGREHMDKARERLEAGYIAELRETTRSLKSLPQVRLHLCIQAERGFAGEVGASLCAALVLHWLAPVCPVCEGRKFRLISGTDELSNRACGACEGSGKAAVPGGQVGVALIGYMDDCVMRARSSISRRLQSRHSA